MRNLLSRYYQAQGISPSEADKKAKNNLVIFGTAGHLDLVYLGDYYLDAMTSVLIFDYINGKLGLMKYNEYVALNPTTGDKAIFFANCNETVAIGTDRTNWTTYRSDMIIILCMLNAWGMCGSGGG